MDDHAGLAFIQLRQPGLLARSLEVKGHADQDLDQEIEAARRDPRQGAVSNKRMSEMVDQTIAENAVVVESGVAGDAVEVVRGPEPETGPDAGAPLRSAWTMAATLLGKGSLGVGTVGRPEVGKEVFAIQAGETIQRCLVISKEESPTHPTTAASTKRHQIEAETRIQTG